MARTSPNRDAAENAELQPVSGCSPLTSHGYPIYRHRLARSAQAVGKAEGQAGYTLGPLPAEQLSAAPVA